MTPKEAIDSLRHAKSNHLEWLASVQAFFAGISHENLRAPVNYKNCKFGQWLYQGDGKKLSALQNYSCIEVPHKYLHLAYASFFNNILEESTSTVHPEFLTAIEGLSSTLIKAIELLEDEIEHLSIEDFKALVK